MNHVVIDKFHGIIFIKLDPPAPIDVEFKAVSSEVEERPEPVLMAKLPQLKNYPVPDEKLLEKGKYISSSQAATILGADVGHVNYLALCDHLPAYRKEHSRKLLFLLTDVVDRLNKDN